MTFPDGRSREHFCRFTSASRAPRAWQDRATPDRRILGEGARLRQFSDSGVRWRRRRREASNSTVSAFRRSAAARATRTPAVEGKGNRPLGDMESLALACARNADARHSIVSTATAAEAPAGTFVCPRAAPAHLARAPYIELCESRRLWLLPKPLVPRKNCNASATSAIAVARPMPLEKSGDQDARVRNLSHLLQWQADLSD